MMRFIMPIVLVGIALSVFFMLTNPILGEISTLNGEISSYNNALDNSKALENERDKLTAKYNTINPDNLAKLQKLLPENVDNIRLILEIEQIASPYGMALTDVKYSTISANTASTPAVAGAVTQNSGVSDPNAKDYGIFDLEFAVSGTYNNFINFTKDLESNLRIVDISSIAFSSDTSSNVGTQTAEVYKYDFKIKTYWLKN